MPRSESRSSAKYASGSRSADATAGWNGAPDTKVRNCLAVRTARTRWAGPVAQPTFQPVNENVLPAELIVSVRSRIPGRVASGRCVHVEGQVLVDLVGHDDQVVLDRELGDGGQFVVA